MRMCTQVNADARAAANRNLIIDKRHLVARHVVLMINVALLQRLNRLLSLI